MKSHYYVLALSTIFLTACAWVEPTKESAEVTLVKAFNINACKHLGTTKITVTQKVGIFSRSEESVNEELVTMAKNRAATMDGDSIVALEPAIDGTMSFEIYKCARE